MSAFQFASTGSPQRRRRDPPEERRPRGGEPRNEEALPDGAVQYIAQAILREPSAEALAEEILAEAPAPAVGGWAAGEEALEKVKEEAEALKRAAALQL